jgi:gas vesicle protein
MSSKEVSSFFTGFFIGALVGGAAALLFAPQSGEETRTQIRERSIELREKAEATYGDVVTKIEESTEELRGKAEELSTKLDQIIAQGREELTRIGKRGTEAAPVEEA